MNQRDRLMNTQRAENGARVVYVDLPKDEGDITVSAEIEVTMTVDVEPEVVRDLVRDSVRDALYPRPR